MEFVRFGGLSPVKQDQYETSQKTFHNPPRKRGLYAFPWPYIEKFLIGSTSDPGHVSNKSMWILDDDGNKMRADLEDTDPMNPIIDLIFTKYRDVTLYKPFFKNILRKYGAKEKDVRTAEHGDHTYFALLKKPRYFKYDGEIWSHLDTLSQTDILERSGSWFLSTTEDFEKALDKERHEMLKLNHNWDFVPGKSKARHVGMDHLEVFIEKL